ncbi:O-antigen ligase family protein [Microscilla marina]|uniref:O-Antigen Polymerase family n=1 Tax=Microscilla marina ATCC 23134 TaxID=313606 RepID=A1ZI84_MICM2|nr:O-antigen ligase family protein [Microscilla marina]EAY29752.1 O-Antigen Polymerase family [Microscilla marina ATCC 23134]
MSILKQDNLLFITILLVTVTLPISMLANNISIVLMLLVWIMEGKWRAKLQNLKSNNLSWIFIGFYILHLIGMLYTNNTSEGAIELEKRLSLLIFPLVLGSTTKQFTKTQFHLILKTFVFSCTLASSTMLLYAIYQVTGQNQGVKVLFYDLLSMSSVIKMHPIYIAMYMGFCLFIILYLLQKFWHSTSALAKIGSIVLFIYTLAFIFLTGARMPIISIVLIIITQFIAGYQKQILTTNIALASLFIGIVVIVIMKFDILQHRFKIIYETNISQIFAKDYQYYNSNQNAFSMRLVKWRCSVEVIYENFLFGVGTGDTEDQLVICYDQKKFWGRLAGYRFNSHNIYLQDWLRLGLIGFTLLMLSFILPIIKAVKQKKALYLTFITLFMLCGITESLMNANKGIVFFAFFSCIFAFKSDIQGSST